MSSCKFKKHIIICWIFILVFILTLTFMLFNLCDINVANAEEYDELKDSASYMLKNKATGYYLSVNSDESLNGAHLLQLPKTQDLNQRFMIRYNRYNWFIYRDRFQEAIAVDVSGKSSAEGTPIITWETTNDINQLYRFIENSDGSYKIYTGASNYTKCIGVENNSRTPGTNCVQMSPNNDTTTWILEEIWGFSYIRNFYFIQQNYPSAKYDSIFGTPSLMNEKIIRGERMSAKSVFGTIKTEPCDAFLYRYWRYSIPINVCVHDFGINISLNPNQTYTYQIQKTQTTTESYAKSISYGLSNSVKSNLGAKLNLNILSLESNINNVFTINIDTQFSYSKTNTFSISETETIQVEHPDNAENKPYTYKLEMRAVMYLYYVQVFNFLEDRSETKNGIWTYYNYNRAGSICFDEQFHWEMLPPEKGLNPYQFDPESGKYNFCGEKNTGVIYV